MEPLTPEDIGLIVRLLLVLNDMNDKSLVDNGIFNQKYAASCVLNGKRYSDYLEISRLSEFFKVDAGNFFSKTYLENVKAVILGGSNPLS